MAYYIDQQDYYFGATLCVFFTQNQDARPSMVDSLNGSRCYEMSSDSCDFYLYMKHSENPKPRDGSISWDFGFSKKEREWIQKHISENNRKTFIILLCSEEAYKNTVIAVLTQKEYLSLTHKSTIRIKWEMAKSRRKQKFTIPNKGGNPLQIDCNRITKKFTEIQDAL